VSECLKEDKQFCPECTLGLDLKHTDVLILSQYLRTDGCILPRRITKLCKRQQKKITYLVAMAQKAGLMSNLTPSQSKKDPKQRFAHKKFNHYFDEKTIKY
jgi:small subunit ribosomal protein S18